MKGAKVSILVILGLFAGNLVVSGQQIDPPSLQLDAGPSDNGAETKLVDIEIVSLELTSTKSSEVGGDGEDIGAPETRGTELDDIGARISDDGDVQPDPIGFIIPDTDEDSSDFSIEREMKESGEKGGTEDMNIGIGEMHDNEHKDWIVIESATGDGGETRMNKADLINEIANKSEGGLRSGYLKIGDIKGETTDDAADSSADKLDSDSDSASRAKKPKEIVVVGSLVRESGVPQLVRVEAGGEVLADSFFDIWVESADREEAVTADSFFDIFVDAGEERLTPDSFFDIFVDVTDEDLQLQAVSVAQRDENVSSVSLKDGELKVEYDERMKLFGFIPVDATRSVIVNTNSDSPKVKVKFPWWRFLASSDTDGKQLESDINDALSKSIPTTSDSDDRPTEEVAFYYNKVSAQTLQTISNISKAN